MILTIYDDDERIFQAVCAGACGYLLKKTPPARLMERLREVAAGGAPMLPQVARRIVDVFREFRPPQQMACHLSPQESRLLKLLAEGPPLQDRRRRRQLEAAFASAISEDFDGRILAFDEDAAREAARRAAERRAAGRPVDFRDIEIAGIVTARRATLATRNIRHFHGLGIELVNPWAKR